MGLTTVDQFISEMGFVATQMLIKLINGETLDTQTYRMKTSLVIRNSCRESPFKSSGSRTSVSDCIENSDGKEVRRLSRCKE